MSDFAGKNVVVTGGSGALGRAVVGLLVRRGAQVHVPCVEAAVPDSVAGLEGVRAAAGVDLTDAAAVTAFYADVPELWASIQIAGGFRMAPFADTSLEDLRFLLDINVVTCFNACHEAVKAMQGRGGRIVNVAARPALSPLQGAGVVAYAASKSAVATLTQALGEEVAKDDIFVNAVVPSIIDTPANRAAMPDAKHADWAKVEDLAETIVQLASPTNRVIRSGLVPVFGRA